MTEQIEAVTEKKGRGDGLVKVSFADQTKKDHKRVPEGVVAVVINGREYAISAIPSNVRDQLVAFAIKTRATTYVNNHADDAKQGTDVPELVNKVYSDLVAGRLYAENAEGGAKKEKAYDPSDWVEASRQARAIMHKANHAVPLATEAQLDLLRQKLVSMSGKERTDFVNKLRKDPLIGAAYQAIQASKRVAKYNASKAEDKEASVMSELF